MTTSRHFANVRVAVGRIDLALGALEDAGFPDVRRIPDDGTVPEGLALVQVDVLTQTPGWLADEVHIALNNAGVPHEPHSSGVILDAPPERLG